jgi:ribosomal protein S18 acetylase RimI-like enzyme
MDYKIRNCKTKDFDIVFELLKQLWPGKELNKSSLKNVFEQIIRSENEESVCAEINGNVVGFCTLSVRNSLWQESRMGHICELVVDESFRGKQIGTNLINFVCKIAKKRGCKKIELDSAFHREKAHQFYANLEFENRAYLFSKNL